MNAGPGAVDGATTRSEMPAARLRPALPMVRRVLGAVWLLATRLAALFLLLQFYTWFRKSYFQRSAALAFDHALDLIALQGDLRLNVELDLQRWALEHGWVIDFFNGYYRQMKLGIYLSAALALLLAPVGFRRVRRVFVVTTLLAFPWYALYPLAPPRFMQPYGFPFVDTLHAASPVSPSSEGLAGANLYAAMPSMHIGWTAVAALWLVAALPWRRLGVVLGSAHLALMCFAVVVTGNHYVLDIVAGLAIAGAAVLLVRLLPRELPVPWRRGRRPAATGSGWRGTRPGAVPR